METPPIFPWIKENWEWISAGAIILTLSAWWALVQWGKSIISTKHPTKSEMKKEFSDHEEREGKAQDKRDLKNSEDHKNIIFILTANDERAQKLMAALAHDLNELSRKLIK